MLLASWAVHLNSTLSTLTAQESLRGNFKGQNLFPIDGILP